MLQVVGDKSSAGSDLHTSVLNFIALLLTEELKFRLKLEGHRDMDFPFISDCLDNTGTSVIARYCAKGWDVPTCIV